MISNALAVGLLVAALVYLMLCIGATALFLHIFKQR